jgi:hypothetical protein
LQNLRLNFPNLVLLTKEGTHKKENYDKLSRAKRLFLNDNSMFRACAEPVEVWLKIKKSVLIRQIRDNPCSKNFALANKLKGK